MLRPTTLLRAFAAPARRILPLQAAAVPVAAPSSILFRRLQSTTPPSSTPYPPESDPTPLPEAEAAPAAAAPDTQPAFAGLSDKEFKRLTKQQKHAKSGIRQATKARQQQRAQEQQQQPQQKADGEPSPAAPAPKQQPRREPRKPLPGLPYHVDRTPFDELPVYEQSKRGGNKKLTNIKKVEGDKEAFRSRLADGLEMDARDIKLNPTTGHVVVTGFRRKEVMEWLKSQGF